MKPLNLTPGASKLSSLVAKMLCYGVRVSDGSTRRKLLVDSRFDSGFIHGTVLVVGGIPVNTSVLDAAYSSESDACALRIDDDGNYRIDDGSLSVRANMLPMPEFANDPLGRGRVHDYLRLHNNETLFATPVRECSYIAANKPCLFCTFEPGRVYRLSRGVFRDALVRFRRWNPEIRYCAFGGGSPNRTDYGARYYAELAEVARDEGVEGISVEIVPSRNDATWEVLARNPAVDSIISSIEIWDDDIRARICVGKSEVTKDTYRARWSTAVEVLGAGRVSSVLLVGLEPLESTAYGASSMIAMGVIPTLIPYRPYDSSPLGKVSPVNHESYLELSARIASEMSAQGLSPLKQPGCTTCGACSLEKLLITTTAENA